MHLNSDCILGLPQLGNYRLVSSNKIKGFIPHPTVILPLVLLFLIMSSSVYPAIMASIENKEMQIISKVMAEQPQKDNAIAASRYPARMQMQIASSNTITLTSPTLPAVPTISSIGNSTMMQSQSEAEDNKMELTSINSGKAVHTVWEDDTSGNREIFYKRDGADYDPTTVNLSNNAGVSITPAIAVSGNNVHVLWADEISGNSEILYR